MDDVPLFDLSQLTFDEFVSFFFDMETDQHWDRDPDLVNFSDFNDKGVASPQMIVAHMTRLFVEFADIASRFSLEQINAGIWAMFSYGPFRLQKHLWLPSAPLQERLECIRSIYIVYSSYVTKASVKVMENCFLMWWDLVAGGFWQQLNFDHKIAEGNISSLNEEQRQLGT